MSETPRCCWYQSPSAFGSLARKKNPPIPVTFSISVPPAIPSRTAAPAGGGESFRGTAVCAAMPSWFRPKMKLDPKANDRVRSSWRLGKSIPSFFREERESVYDTCANGVLGRVKISFWTSWTASSPSRDTYSSATGIQNSTECGSTGKSGNSLVLSKRTERQNNAYPPNRLLGHSNPHYPRVQESPRAPQFCSNLAVTSVLPVGSGHVFK